MTINAVLVSSFIGYLLGCIQTAYFTGRIFHKIDIRKHGSNNAGASNVTNVMGWKFGIITALVDILKASVAVWAVSCIYGNIPELLFISGAAAIIGHIFPFFLKFKGGKGAASLIGMALALDLKLAIILIAFIILITLISDYIALGTIAMFAILPVYSYIAGYSYLCVIVSLGLTFIGFTKHFVNVKRILKKEETGLRKVMNKNQ